MNSIKIFRGDDTNYNNEKFLRIKINTNYSLVGFKGIFRLGCFESVSENLIVSEENEKYGEMEVSIPREKSSLFQFGEMKGILRLVDTEDRYKTVATEIPFFVTNKVFVQEEDEFELSVPEGSEVSIIVNAYASTGGTSDYNKLQNKPTYEGKTIEGNLTHQSLGIAPLQSLNSLGEEVNVIKTDLGDLGDQVHETEAKIPENTSDKNQLVNASQLSEKEQEIRSDVNRVDAELQTQVNAHATEITTIKQDLGDLGEQVANIESKIPEETSGTNPLVNKQQLLDEEMDIRKDLNQGLSELQTQITAQASAIANKVDTSGDTMTGALNVPELNVQTPEGTLNLSITAGVATIATNNGLDIVSQTKFDKSPTTDDNTTWADALDTSFVRKAQVATAITEAGGGGSVPENVYTKENLLGGKGVEIVPEPVEGGIDENTLACWHFDGKLEDEVNGLALQTNTAILNTDYVKFGTGSCQRVGKYTEEFSSSNDFSFDFWALVGIPGGSSYASMTVTIFSSYYGKGVYSFLTGSGEKLKTQLEGEAYPLPETEFTTNRGEWAHYYCHYDSKKRVFDLFANGKRVSSRAITTDFSRATIEIGQSGVTRFDEVRISKCIRWTEDFTPPTQPYRKAEPTGNYVINGATKTSQLKNDTYFVSGDGIGKIKRITQAEYDSLATKDENTFYVLVG